MKTPLLQPLDPQEKPEPLASGIPRTVRGYELQRLIATGGFGAVYQAYQPVVEREVAIKVILPQYADHPTFIRRFEVEAQLIARLEHLHIVPLYDFWREPGGAFLVMRWLRGGSVRSALSRRGAFSLTDASKLLDQVSAALHVAHDSGIIHRDLKPDNILLDEFDNAFLADFGIAQDVMHESDAKIGHMGTVAYAAPEQIERKPASAQTDIYSLGILLYELLTGRLPFVSSSDTILMYKQVYEPLPPLERARPDLPQGANLVIWRATAKNVEERYTDVLTMAAEFRRLTTSAAEPQSKAVVIDGSTQLTPAIDPFTTRNLFVVPGRNPYKGLRAFSEADAHDFYGRNALIERLIDHFQTKNFLAVIGPSGSGKSSAVMAGLIPRLRAEGLPRSSTWFYVQMMPGDTPFAELEAALLRVAAHTPDNLQKLLRTDWLSAIDQLLPKQEVGDPTPLVLVIDQFEELFTATEQETERVLFLTRLRLAVEAPDSRLKVVLTLRADFYDRPLLYPTFGELVRQHTEVVLPLIRSEMERAIVLPAEKQNVRFDPGLVGMIIDEVDEQPGALPLLQYALTELYERRDGDRLTSAAYQEIGGLLGALTRRADDLYDDLSDEAQAVAEQIFLRLVQPGVGTEDTRRRALRSELLTLGNSQTVRFILDRFGQFRLLTFDYEPATRAPTVEIAHEALLRGWIRLRAWIDASRDDLRLHAQLATAASEWESAGRDPSYVASGARLAAFEVLRDEGRIALGARERDYLDAGTAARKRASQRLRLFIASLAAAAVVSLVLAVFAFVERDRADREGQVSRSRELAVTSLLTGAQVDLSLLLSMEALNISNTLEARNSLLTGLQGHPYLMAFLHGHTGEVRAVTYSPDGRILASAGQGSTIRLWDVDAHREIRVIESAHSAPIDSLVFSPDGQLLVSGGEDGVVQRWDVETGNAVGDPLLGHQDAVRAIAFSADGMRIASGSLDMTARLWDAESGELIGEPLTAHEDAVLAVAFSPDSRLLATGGWDGTIRLWEAETAEPVGDPLRGHNGLVLALAFSPDGQLLATGGSDDSVLLWVMDDLESGGFPLVNHQDDVRDLSFSPDSRWLASASNDDTVRLSAIDGTAMISYRAHTDNVWSVEFRPDGAEIATGGRDGRVLLWLPPEKPLLAERVFTADTPLMALSLSPDGRQLAAAGGTGSNFQIRLWDNQTGEEQPSIEGHSDLITTLAYNPDGSLLASSGRDSVIHLWSTADGSPVRTLPLEPGEAAFALAFSPDGKLLASASESGLRLWNPVNGLLIAWLEQSMPVLALSFSPDGAFLASGGDDGLITLWDVKSGEISGTPLEGHTDAVSSLAFSPDGTILASGSRDYSILLWNVSSRQALRQPLVGHNDWLSGLAFSPDGTILASSSHDSTIRLWDTASGQAQGQGFAGHFGRVNGLLFGNNGLLSAGQDRRLIAWSLNPTAWRSAACTVANRDLSTDEWGRYFEGISYRTTCTDAP
jgi:WD40 repeat protein/serine/threonine protein kinase